MRGLRGLRTGRFYSQIIIILLGLITVRLWMMPVGVLPQASAQPFDSAQQRFDIIEEGKKTNALLAKIHLQLKEGTLKVQVLNEPEADKNGKPRGAQNH